MRIVADKNISLLDELFAALGELVKLPGGEITRATVVDADVLLVRTVTRVGEELLRGSRVKFVGAASAGCDHVDRDWLDRQGIAFSHAPGCNANAVAEYVLAALAALEPDWRDKQIGIIGCGNVGGRLYRRLTGLGVACRCNDPFLTPAQQADLTSIEETLQADIVCLHTPLTRDGPYPTYHLLDAANLDRLQPDTVLLNAGRGAVIDNRALLHRLQKRNDLRVVLDVWEHEPQISLKLMDAVALSTPHIAGASIDGKRNGALMVYRTLCRWMGAAESANPPEIETAELYHIATLNQALTKAYDIRSDDRHIRETLHRADNPAAAFEHLRQSYPPRKEFGHYKVEVAETGQWNLMAALQRAGFVLSPTSDQQ